MKRIIILAALVIGVLISRQSFAQPAVSVNIGIQPIWGPVGYEHVDYYYLPDIDAYYDVPGHVYVYLDGGVWVRRPSLPPRYANFDLYHAYKAVVNVPEPWLHHNIYHDKYIVFRGHHDQVVIRDSREPKYYVIKEHPMHGQYHPEHYENHPQQNHRVEHDHR